MAVAASVAMARTIAGGVAVSVSIPVAVAVPIAIAIAVACRAAAISRIALSGAAIARPARARSRPGRRGARARRDAETSRIDAARLARTRRRLHPNLGDGDDRRLTGRRQLDAMTPAAAHTDDDRALFEKDDRFCGCRIDLQNRAAHAKRGGRRGDLIGLLVGVAGREAQSALDEIDGDRAASAGAAIDETIESDRGGRTERQIGVVAKH